MNWTYLAVLAAILLVVLVLVRWVVRAQWRWGRLAAWSVIIVEAVAVGVVMWLAVKYVPGMADSWIGQQLVLALVGIGLAIFVGGGLVMALGRR